MGGIEPDHEVKHSHEYRALTTYLSNKPQPFSNAKESFCKPTEEIFMSSQSASEVESQLWRVWKAVVATATQTPHDSPAQQKLADFVLELRNRPVLERQGKVCKVWEAVVWKDLPILGPQMREAWNDGEFLNMIPICRNQLLTPSKSRHRSFAPSRPHRLDQPECFHGDTSQHHPIPQHRFPARQRLLSLRNLDHPHGARGR